MRSTKVVLLMVCAVASSPSWSVERSLSWTSPHCTYALRYDSKKYDQARLQDTINFIYFGEGLEFVPPAYSFTPAGIQKLNIDEFQKRCEDSVRNANSLALIDFPGLEAYRQVEVDALRDECAYGAVKIKGLTQGSSLLRDYAPALEACSHHIDALEGKSDLIAHWQEVFRSLCEKNSDPVACRNRHLAHETKPDALAWIKLDVLSFGWNNCARKYSKINAADKEVMRKTLQQRFDRLFKVRQRCE